VKEPGARHHVARLRHPWPFGHRETTRVLRLIQHGKIANRSAAGNPPGFGVAFSAILSG
jgi:hypothetical protein